MRSRKRKPRETKKAIAERDLAALEAAWTLPAREPAHERMLKMAGSYLTMVGRLYETTGGSGPEWAQAVLGFVSAWR